MGNGPADYKEAKYIFYYFLIKDLGEEVDRSWK